MVMSMEATALQNGVYGGVSGSQDTQPRSYRATDGQNGPRTAIDGQQLPATDAGRGQAGSLGEMKCIARNTRIHDVPLSLPSRNDSRPLFSSGISTRSR